MISLKDRDTNRGIPEIGFQYYDEDCSDLSSFFPDIFVMQATDTRQSNHFIISRSLILNRATYGWVFTKMIMRPVSMVIFNIFLQQLVQVVLIENNHIIEQLPGLRKDVLIGTIPNDFRVLVTHEEKILSLSRSIYLMYLGALSEEKAC